MHVAVQPYKNFQRTVLKQKLMFCLGRKDGNFGPPETGIPLHWKSLEFLNCFAYKAVIRYFIVLLQSI